MLYCIIYETNVKHGVLKLKNSFIQEVIKKNKCFDIDQIKEYIKDNDQFNEYYYKLIKKDNLFNIKNLTIFKIRKIIFNNIYKIYIKLFKTNITKNIYMEHKTPSIDTNASTIDVSITPEYTSLIERSIPIPYKRKSLELELPTKTISNDTTIGDKMDNIIEERKSYSEIISILTHLFFSSFNIISSTESIDNISQNTMILYYL